MTTETSYLDEQYRQDLNNQIKILQRRVRELEYELMWKNLEYDGLPDLDKDVFMISDGVHMRGYFKKYSKKYSDVHESFISFYDYDYEQDFALQDLDENTVWKYTREEDI